MLRAIFEKDSLWVKAVFIVLVPLVLGIFFIVLNNGFLSLFNVTDEIMKLKLTQLFSAFGMFICAPFVLAYLFSSDTRQFLSFNKPSGAVLIMAALSMLVAIPMINFIGELNGQITLPESLKPIEDVLRAYEEKITQLTMSLLTSGDTLYCLMLNLLVMAVIPALGEEFLFRGVLQSSLSERNKLWAVWITAVVFSLVHFQFYGFIPRLLLGAYFGYLLIWSRSIWVPVIAHFANNATIVIYYFFYKNKTPDIDIEAIGIESSPLCLTGSVVLFAFLTFLIWREGTKA